MAVEQATSLNITCDNPNCPGTDLDPTDRKDWFFISSEFYGQPTQQHVFCSKTCASESAASPEASFGEKVDPITPMPPEPPTEIKPPTEETKS